MKETLKNDIIAISLLDELTRLNRKLNVTFNMTELIKNGGIFLYGLNPSQRIAPEVYRFYVSFMNSITLILTEFDICIKNNGYAYIIDATMLIIDQNRLDIKLGNDVYPYIRKKYNLSDTHIVEHNIRNAIKASFKRSRNEESISRMSAYEKQPTNKEFLFRVTQDVCSMMYRDLVGSIN